MEWIGILAMIVWTSSVLFGIWLIEKYGEAINLFIDNRASRLECPFVDKLYDVVSFLSSVCFLGMLVYVIWMLFTHSLIYVILNEFSLILFWLFLFWIFNDVRMMYSRWGGCNHRDYVVITSVQDVSGWCPSCGALEIDGVWKNPREGRRANKKKVVRNKKEDGE